MTGVIGRAGRRPLPFGLVGRAAHQVDLKRAPQHQRAAGLVPGARFHQHSANVGVDDDRVGLGTGLAFAFLQRAALAAVPRVGGGILIGDFALGEALQADAQPRRVHHDEHRLEALLRLADQPALRAVIIHDAGRVAVDAHLLLERAAADRVALAHRAVVVHQELRHDEQGDALDVVGRARDAWREPGG